MMEPCFNVALEDQAVGRVYRLGQKREVHVVRLIVEDTIEARERMDPQGAVITPLDEAALQKDLRMLLESGIESLTISFLHSYACDAHERRAAEIARGLDPSLAITAASDIVAER